jgi:hypothetical protein
MFIVSTPLNVGGPFVSVHHEMEFSPGEFQMLLGEHFSNITLFGQRRELVHGIKLLGSLPDRYRETIVRTGQGSVGFFKLLDRLNKLPNHLLAWALGYGESMRSRIRPLGEALALTPLLKSNYYAMIAICRP